MAYPFCLMTFSSLFGIYQWSPNFELGAGCRFFGHPWAKAREKKSSLQFNL